MTIDIATAYSKYKFLGYEFLTWLWFVMENDPSLLAAPDQGVNAVNISHRMVLENPTMDRIERITAKGDPANFDTGMLSLQQGALITEMGMVFKGDGHEWRFTLKGENLSVSNLKTPPTAPIETSEDVESAVLEKAYLLDQVMTAVDRMFQTFVKQRLSVDWPNRIVPEINRWIESFRQFL